MITTSSLQQIVNAGGSLVLNYSDYTSLNLESLARSLHDGATLTLKVWDRYSVPTLTRIANVKPGQVIFDFTA